MTNPSLSPSTPNATSLPSSAAKQEWIFIDESNTINSPPIQPLNPHPAPDPEIFKKIVVPFPPKINPPDLIRRNKKNGELLSRATNKFLIYRNEFSKELSKQLESCGCSKLSMRDVSRMAAMAWKNEPRRVKRKYEDIAREVETIHVKLLISSPSYQSWGETYLNNQNDVANKKDNGCTGSTSTNASVKSSSVPVSVPSVATQHHHHRNNPSTNVRYAPYNPALAPHATVRSQQHAITSSAQQSPTTDSNPTSASVPAHGANHHNPNNPHFLQYEYFPQLGQEVHHNTPSTLMSNSPLMPNLNSSSLPRFSNITLGLPILSTSDTDDSGMFSNESSIGNSLNNSPVNFSCELPEWQQY
ncbi:56_t:CDS:2 [Acaulospora morrowiae]|uniref:56_t:CDS:1 n=1 Tax=Acaulospora morrowiae TaxID=94023 RepID=A0A9N8WP74_9GLOM|nr:56_t:CDS:2 [Acaulospora morrowiae]